MAVVFYGENVRVVDGRQARACGPELEVTTVDRRALIDAREALDLRDALTDWLQAIGRDHPNPGDARP
jgi:hypothetical protein